MDALFSAGMGRRLRPEVVSIANLIETVDWSATQHGKLQDWPVELISALRIMLAASLPMVLFIGLEGRLVYNAAYARFAGRKHPAILGEPIDSAWPELAPVYVDAHGVCKSGDTISHEDHEALIRRSEHAEQVWMDMDFSPVMDAGGQFLATIGIVYETTAKVAAERALMVANAEFRALADTMPQMVWSTLPDGFHDYYNARWYEFTGVPEGSTDGEGWNNMFHPDDQEEARQKWAHSLQTGELYEIEYRLRHHSGQYRWTLGRALPVRDNKGRIQRWFGTCTDIHDTKVAAAERELIAQELSHRIKNIFSVLNGLISLSARAQPECSDFANQLRTRIQAMGVAHDYVRPHSKHSKPDDEPTSLHTLIRLLLGPFNYGTDIEIKGDDAVIDSGAATPVSLFIHELATNASKYGGLSPSGKGLRVKTAVSDETVEILWCENFANPGGKEPPLEGFGTRLISLTVTAQMNGEIERAWREDGLDIRVCVPITAMSRTGQIGS